jgi:hypothetical protein
MRTLDRIATAIVLFLGVGHVAATPRFAPGFTEGAAWFSGSGLTLVFVAFLNLSRFASPEPSRRLRGLCFVANALTLAWIVFVSAIVPVPQAFLAAAAVLIVTVASLLHGQKAAKAVG